MIPQIGPLEQLIASILASLSGGENGGMGISQTQAPPQPAVTGQAPALHQFMEQSKEPMESRPAVAHYRTQLRSPSQREDDQATTRRTRP